MTCRESTFVTDGTKAGLVGDIAKPLAGEAGGTVFPRASTKASSPFSEVKASVGTCDPWSSASPTRDLDRSVPSRIGSKDLSAMPPQVCAVRGWVDDTATTARTALWRYG